MDFNYLSSVVDQIKRIPYALVSFSDDACNVNFKHKEMPLNEQYHRPFQPASIINIRWIFTFIWCCAGHNSKLVWSNTKTNQSRPSHHLKRVSHRKTRFDSTKIQLCEARFSSAVATWSRRLNDFSAQFVKTKCRRTTSTRRTRFGALVFSDSLSTQSLSYLLIERCSLWRYVSSDHHLGELRPRFVRPAHSLATRSAYVY